MFSKSTRETLEKKNIWKVYKKVYQKNKQTPK